MAPTCPNSNPITKTKHPRACYLGGKLLPQSTSSESEPETEPRRSKPENQPRRSKLEIQPRRSKPETQPKESESSIELPTDDESEVEPESGDEKESLEDSFDFRGEDLDDESESDSDDESESDSDDESESDSNDESESDSDDSEPEYRHKIKKQRTLPGNEQPIFLQAMQKTVQISKALKAYINSKDVILNYKKWLITEDVNRACGIRDDDLTKEMKPYQIKGVNFLWILRKLGVEGVILADEMGLGKTIQVIAFLAALKDLEGNRGPHLVVVPVSVLENWEDELARWCPSFNGVVYHGNTKREFCRNRSYGGDGGVVPFEILITSYSIFEGSGLQMKRDRKFLRRFSWDCVVMDEGHCLMDATSYRNKRLQSIVYNAKQRIMLTGTPVENDLKELWALLSFLMPKLFERAKDDDGIMECFGARKDMPQDEVLAKMQKILKPFVMRQNKSDVLNQLPPKRRYVVKCDMAQAPYQDEIYKGSIKHWQSYAISKMSNGIISNALTLKERSSIFRALRKISNHPLLVRKNYNNKHVMMLASKFHKLGVFGKQCTLESVCKTLASSTDYDLHKLCEVFGGIENGPSRLPDDFALSSTKCQTLAGLLLQLQSEGHRCLLFSQWSRTLDILEWALQVLRYTYIRLDGKTKVDNRQDLVNEFNNNNNVFIFLISSHAGGEGLNLVGADTVIIHDGDFNTQVDCQAEDCCHRIGQTKPVTVYKLVTGNSVDENIFDIAQKKLTLDATLLQTPKYESDIVRKTLNV